MWWSSTPSPKRKSELSKVTRVAHQQLHGPISYSALVAKIGWSTIGIWGVLKITFQSLAPISKKFAASSTAQTKLSSRVAETITNSWFGAWAPLNTHRLSLHRTPLLSRRLRGVRTSGGYWLRVEALLTGALRRGTRFPLTRLVRLKLAVKCVIWCTVKLLMS